MGKLVSTLIGVVIAVGGFSALWVGANLLFNQITRNFRLFASISGGVLGAVLMAVIDGNQLLTGLVARPSSLFNGPEAGIFTDGIVNAAAGHLFWPIIGAAIGSGLGLALAVLDDWRLRLIASLVACGGTGVILSLALRTRYELALRSTPLVVWTVLLLLIGVGVAALRRGDLIRGGLLGASIGWLLGALGGALQGVSVTNQAETTLAFLVAGLLAGGWIGLHPVPDRTSRAKIDDRSRAWLFVGPAVLFISVMLIIPAVQTVLLSIQEDDAANIVDGFIGLENYRTVFGDDDNLDTSSMATLLSSDSEQSTSLLPWGGSALIPWVLFFAAVGVALAFLLGRETGQAISFGGAPLLPLLIAAGLFSFALFTHVRGTIINNLWWVVAVTMISTAIGLAVAKLADGAQFESVAKTFVFMPMAISFVGASIIWRLMMYQARDVSKNQTGLFNAMWVALGRATTEWASAGSIVLGLILAVLAVVVLIGTLTLQTRYSTAGSLAGFGIGSVGAVITIGLLVASYRTMGGKLFIGGVFALAAVGLAYAGIRSLSSSLTAAVLYLSLTIIPLWVMFRTFGDGIGGFVIQEGGDVRGLTVNFVQGSPYNSWWLMVILIWIQTGFAMVILSAAIKAVPEDFIEAAKIDGATDGQIFWRITVPQIMPTIGVVATTIMVNVMKVFDIVKVTTNGQFGSQVLANAMYEQAFQFANFGVGSALAVLIFIGVFPVMVYNIYRLTKEA
jgi:alpha-glucoside transport system permease protein